MAGMFLLYYSEYSMMICYDGRQSYDEWKFMQVMCNSDIWRLIMWPFVSCFIVYYSDYIRVLLAMPTRLCHIK